jgi:hypothetical protein
MYRCPERISQRPAVRQRRVGRRPEVGGNENVLDRNHDLPPALAGIPASFAFE